MNSIEQQKEHFDNIALEYYTARQNPNSLEFKRLLWDYVFSFIPHSTKMISVLEPMCGYAEGETIVTTHYCKDINYIGFDYSENLINIVKKSWPNKNVFVQDVTTFKPERKYDLILILGGLHHVPDYTTQVLRIMNDSLEEGGYLINLEPSHGNRISKAIRDRIYRSSPIVDYQTEKDYAVKELTNIYIETGFRIVHQFYPGLLAYSLYYNPDMFPRLSRINPKALRTLFALEKPFYKSRLARFFSFATLSILSKSNQQGV